MARSKSPSVKVVNVEKSNTNGTRTPEPKVHQGFSGSKRKNGKENESINVVAGKENKKAMKKVKFANSCDNEVILISQAKATKSRKTNDPVKYNADNDSIRTKKNGAKAKVLKAKIVSLPQTELEKEVVLLPAGKSLALPVEEKGAALQFLQFCTTFSEILGLKGGQAESVLKDVASKSSKNLRGHSVFVQFLMKLLSIIFEDVKPNGDAWLELLKTCIEESEIKLKDLNMDYTKMCTKGIENLDPSKKLLILNFLCDEVLLTHKMRKFIDEAETKFDDIRREAKEKVADARKKEKQLKEDVKKKITESMDSARDGNPLSLFEFDKLLSKLRDKADKVQAEITTSLGLVHKKNQRSDAIRTDPIAFDSYGKIFWKLSSYDSSANIILQDVGNLNSVTLQDKWLVYDKEEEDMVEKYIASIRGSGSLVTSNCI